MGMSEGYFVGPYIRATFHYENRENVYFGCPKCCIIKSSDTKFCEKCGTETGDFILMKKRPSANYYDISELGDTFYTVGEVELPDGIEILLPNEYRDRPREWKLEDMAENFFEFNDVESEVEWFQNAFKDEIETLEQYYDIVQVCWGFVRTCS